MKNGQLFVPSILHKLCFQFLQVTTVVSREIEDSAFSKTFIVEGVGWKVANWFLPIWGVHGSVTQERCVATLKTAVWQTMRYMAARKRYEYGSVSERKRIFCKEPITHVLPHLSKSKRFIMSCNTSFELLSPIGKVQSMTSSAVLSSTPRWAFASFPKATAIT